MKMILNEKKYAEALLEGKELSNKPSTDVYVLVKYYYHLGLSPDDVMDKVMEFIEEVTGNSKGWKSKIKRSVKTLKDSKLNIVEEVHITKLEMDTILALKNEPLEKLAFGLLVWLKVHNVAKGKQNEWLNLDNSLSLFRDIQVNRNSVDGELMIGTLEELGYVFNSVRSGSCSMKLNYIDLEGEPVLTITSFDDFIMDYYIYKGSKVIKCKECGKRVMVKGNASTKYCPQCKKEKELERHKRYNEKRCK